MPTPTETWQDRRGMFQRGKEVHQPGRKLSNQFGDPLAARRTSTGSTGGGGLEKTDSIPEPGSLGQRRRVSLVVVPMLPVQCRDQSACGCITDVYAIRGSHSKIPDLPAFPIIATHHLPSSHPKLLHLLTLPTTVIRRLPRPLR